MTRRITDVLEVLSRICSSEGPVRIARIRAIHAIAAERGVTHQTIGDAYLRRLEPEIKGTRAFDQLVQEWLDESSPALERALMKKAGDRDDELAIERFFRRTTRRKS